MGDGLERIETLAGAMLKSLAPGSRRQLLRQMARGIAKTQRDRIARQQQPDGTKFAPRKPKAECSAGSYPLRFLYPKGAAEPRLVTMASWARQGPLVTGYDQEAGAIRSFFWDKVAKWLPTGETVSRGSNLRRRGAIRQRAMFRKLRTGRYLRSDASDAEAWIGFSGQASAIAQIHQGGLREKPSVRARSVRYEKRELLGISEVDRAALIDEFLAKSICRAVDGN
ncbi:phage virion morphogenesis protein [Sphingomonas sp. LT1P40]|uniref:phage virion morphogenesis protein n=1 Tax=Alteristakelama amylovorans TaxID=3096166 RepID=UPI002FC936F0